VKVSVVRGGGIAGIATRTDVETEALPPDAGRRLARLAAAVTPVADAPVAPAHPDETLYRVTVDGVTATYTESTLPEPVRELIDFVGARPERRESLELPGKR
jgi:hypothetical protein